MGMSKGYNYRTGRWSLDCDNCGTLGANRIKCPARWCSALQLCANCAKVSRWRSKKTHAKCFENTNQAERERVQFLSENAQNWVVVSAWGSWAEWVPNGMVGVCAYRGGNPAGRVGEPAYFLVPQPEYADQGRHNFIIDEARHPRFENDPTQLRTKELVIA